jgi:glucosamine-6-phosphate deaminase
MFEQKAHDFPVNEETGQPKRLEAVTRSCIHRRLVRIDKFPNPVRQPGSARVEDIRHGTEADQQAGYLGLSGVHRKPHRRHAFGRLKLEETGVRSYQRFDSCGVSDLYRIEQRSRRCKCRFHPGDYTGMSAPIVVRKLNSMNVQVFASKKDLGQAAAEQAAGIIRAAVERRGEARIIVATGNSQLEFIEALVRIPDVPWNSVHVFHMDEYFGMSEDHPASFRRWIRQRVVDRVRPKSVHYLDGTAPDAEAECLRYARLIMEGPIDVAFVGIGENGHIAFNDPPVADFFDPNVVKVVTLDEACRRQQVGEGHFPSLEEAPRVALTLTCPALMRAEHLVCCVPDARKAKAVQAALEGPVTTGCPGSLLRTHPSAHLYLDQESASLLKTS